MKEGTCIEPKVTKCDGLAQQDVATRCPSTHVDFRKKCSASNHPTRRPCTFHVGVNTNGDATKADQHTLQNNRKVELKVEINT